VRFRALTAALIGCAAAFGAASDGTHGASRPPWRVYKVTTTWSVTRTVELTYEEGTCRETASITGRSNPFYVGTPATRKVTSFGVRTARTRAALAYGKRAQAFTVPARMTLTVGETTCDGSAHAGSCAGTYHSVGGVIGYVAWSPTEDPKAGPSELVWSHKIDIADRRPPTSCGPDLGEPVYELFFGGRYNPGRGGTHQGGKEVPLERRRLLARKRFVTEAQGSGDTDRTRTKATFTPVR
jgi:hypothetical protein